MDLDRSQKELEDLVRYYDHPSMALLRHNAPQIQEAETKRRELTEALAEAQQKLDSMPKVFEVLVQVPPAIPPAIENILVQLEGSVRHGIKRIANFIESGDDKYLRRNFEEYALTVIASQDDAPYVSPARLLGSGAPTDSYRCYRGLIEWTATGKWEGSLSVVPLDRVRDTHPEFEPDYEAFVEFVHEGADWAFRAPAEDDDISHGHF